MDAKMILVVDDDPCCRYILETFLRSSGFTVVSATDGLEAVALAVDYRPQLIFMDLNMPEMDGYTATRTIHAQQSTANTSIVAMSANSDRMSRLRAFEAGMIGFMSMPWEEMDVARVVDKLWPTSSRMAKSWGSRGAPDGLPTPERRPS